MIFRVEKTKDYTVMSNYHLREKEMSLKAKGLLSWMLSNTDDWDYSIQGIVANCKENETAIESALNELKQFGYLTVTKLTPDKTESGRYEYIYNIHEYPIQGVEKQGVEILPLEIQGVENQVQRNTNKRNTNIRNTKEENIILKNNTAEPSIRNYGKRFNPNLTDDVSEKSYDDIPVRKKKMNLYEKCQLEITNFTDDENLREALKTYLDTRLRIKDKPILGIGQWKGLLNTLGRLQGDKLKIVERATERGWASFFELKDYQYNKQNDIKRSVFAEDYGVKSVRPEDVEGGGDSGIKF